MDLKMNFLGVRIFHFEGYELNVLSEGTLQDYSGYRVKY